MIQPISVLAKPKKMVLITGQTMVQPKIEHRLPSVLRHCNRTLKIGIIHLVPTYVNDWNSQTKSCAVVLAILYT